MPVDLAVITRFGPGRCWEVGIWRQTLDRLGLSSGRTRQVVADNSGEEETRIQLIEALASAPWAETVLITAPPVCATKQESKPDAYAFRMADLMNQLAAAAGDATLTLTLDSDILAPLSGDLGGVSAWERLRNHMAEDVALVGTPVPSRWAKRKEVSVYRVDRKQFEPWGKLRRVPIREDDVQEVHAVGTGLALWRTEVMQRYGFRPQPNLCGDKRLGHEWYCYKRMLLDGWRLIVDWGVRPRHYKSETEYVQA